LYLVGSAIGNGDAGEFGNAARLAGFGAEVYKKADDPSGGHGRRSLRRRRSDGARESER